MRGAGHPPLERESAAEQGTGTHDRAVLEGSSTAASAQSWGRLGLAHPRDDEQGHCRQQAVLVPVPSAELACGPADPQRDGGGFLAPEHGVGLLPTGKPAAC